MDRPLLSETSSRPFDVPWRVRDPFYAVFWAYAAVVLLQVAMGIGYGFFCGLNRIAPNRHFLEKIFTASPWSEMFLVVELLLLVLFLSVFVFRRDRSGAARLFRREQAAWEARYSVRMFFFSVLFVFLLGLVVVASIVVAALLLGHDPAAWRAAYDRQIVKEGLSRVTPEAGWFRILFLVVLAPPVEELLFRGAFYGALRKRLSPWMANLASSGFFTLLHGYLAGIPYVFLLGILTARAYERTRSLTAPIGVHVLWNLLKVCALKPVLWPVLSAAVLLLALWGSRASGESPFETATRKPGIEKIGWKVYAWFFIAWMVWGCLDQSYFPLYLLAEIPIYLAVVGYAYGHAWFPKKGWVAYALFYTVYTAYDFWTWTGSLSQKSGSSHPAANVILGTLIVLPSFIVLWRLARPRVDAVSPAVLE